MKKIPLGTADITLSRMGLGTWAIGGGPAWNGDLDRQICIDTILEAHRCGINLIDTAPGYNFGNSEVIVGQALKKLPREQVVVETKCGIVWERKGSLFNKCNFAFFSGLISAQFWAGRAQPKSPELGANLLVMFPVFHSQQQTTGERIIAA